MEVSGNREKAVEQQYIVRERRDWNMILVNAAYTHKREREIDGYLNASPYPGMTGSA